MRPRIASRSTCRQVSKVLITAVLDTEDHRFYLHGGFDIPSTIRALAADSSGVGPPGRLDHHPAAGQADLPDLERKLSRKIKEAVLADRLERKYTKDQILQAYLNTIYLGNGAYGVEAAANVYFNEHASQLTLPQAALLAGPDPEPERLRPHPDPGRGPHPPCRGAGPDGALRRHHRRPRRPRPTPAAAHVRSWRRRSAGDQISDYYVQEVQTELLAPGSPLGGHLRPALPGPVRGRPEDLHQPRTQPAGAGRADRSPPTPRPTARASSRPWSPSTRPPARSWPWSAASGVRHSHYDIITQGTRQPGSGFKLFTLLAALQQGYSIYDTLDAQSPCAIDFPSDHDLVTHPASNDEGNGGGVVTLLNATAQSLNCAYIRLAHEVGPAERHQPWRTARASATTCPSTPRSSSAPSPCTPSRWPPPTRPSPTAACTTPRRSSTTSSTDPGRPSTPARTPATGSSQPRSRRGDRRSAGRRPVRHRHRRRPLQPPGGGQDRHHQQQRRRLVQRLHPSAGDDRVDGQRRRPRCRWSTSAALARSTAARSRPTPGTTSCPAPWPVSRRWASRSSTTALLPAPQYITSPSLVADDVLDHNAA